MTFSDYIAQDSFKTILSVVFDDMNTVYGWTYKPDLQVFYDKYISLILSKTIIEIKANDTASNYQSIITGYTNNAGLPNAQNFISNFLTLTIHDLDVPENISSPYSFFNTAIVPNFDKTNNLEVALNKTGSQILDTTKSVVSSVFSGIGAVLSTAISSLLCNPILIVVIVGIILFIVFKDKIFK